MELEDPQKDDSKRKTDDHTMEYEKVLEEIGFGKTQWMLLIISGLLVLSQLSVQVSTGIIAIASQCEFGMNQQEKGFMMASVQIGLLSTYIWGLISDIYGRRGILIWSTLAACALLFASIFVTNIWAFNVLNFLVGLCGGGINAITYPYLGEFNMAKHLPIVFNFLALFGSLSMVYVTGFAWLVLSYDWHWDLGLGVIIRSWRLLIIVPFLPGLIASLWLITFPESPKFLLAQNKEHDAIDAFDWVCQYNHGRPLLSFLQRTSLKLRPEKFSTDVMPTNQSRGWALLVRIWKATLPLFHRPHRRYVLLSSGMVFLLFFGSIGMRAWYPDIVNSTVGQNSMESATICERLGAHLAMQNSSQTLAEDALLCEDEKISSTTYIYNILFGVTYTGCYAIQGLILKYVHFKHVLYGNLGIASLSVFLVLFVKDSIAVLTLLCLFMITAGLSISITLGAIGGYVPTTLRGKAVSASITLGFAGSTLSTNFIGFALKTMCTGMFGTFTGSMLVTTLFAFFFLI